MAAMNLYQEKSQLSRLIKRVQAGEEIVIAKAGKPVARLVSIDEPVRVRQLGRDSGKVHLAPDFDAPLGEWG